MTTQEWHNDFAARLMHNEGFRLTMYHDSMGIPTIGCGFNLDRDDWSLALMKAGVPGQDCLAVKEGKISLTSAQVGALLNYSDAPIIPQARAELEPGHFDLMSDARRAAFADIDFNIGQGALDQFVTFRGLIDQAVHFAKLGDYVREHDFFNQAADDLLATAYAAQVGARAKRNAEMIRNSGYVAIDAFE